MKRFLLLLPLLAAAQTPELERAHAPMIEPRPDKAKAASTLTTRYSPARVQSSAPVPINNFIDRYVFERMKRDGIPHPYSVYARQSGRRFRDGFGRMVATPIRRRPMATIRRHHPPYRIGRSTIANSDGGSRSLAAPRFAFERAAAAASGPAARAAVPSRH